MGTIAQTVVEIIVGKLGVSPEDVKLDSNFANDLGADSLDMFELIRKFEKTFGIPIPDNVAEKIMSVGDAIHYLEANRDKSKYIDAKQTD